MGAAVKIKARLDINKGAMDRVKRRLRGAIGRFPEHRGSVGLHEDESGDPKLAYDLKATSATLGEVAAYHEFHGRSFLRTWFDQHKDRLGKEMTVAMRAQYQGDKSAVDDLMVKFASELRGWIEQQEGNLKALSDATVQRKRMAGLPRPDVPLVATEQLIDAIKAHLDGYRL